MAAGFKPLLDWFGYSGRERRSSFILIVILVIMISLRYVFPGKKEEIKIIAAEISPASVDVQPEKNPVGDSLKLFDFDPNTASFKELTALGLSGRQAKTLISYRSKGGRFRKPGDIYRIYGLDSAFAKVLIPYVIIKDQPLQMILPVKDDSSLTESVKPGSLPVTEINRSDSAAFEHLPGIGPVLASRIVRYRELLGGFYTVSQLKEVYGLKDSTYSVIADGCIADTTALRTININTAGFRELDRHPYLERYDVQAIIKYRELNGRIETLADLVRNKVFTAEKAGKIRPYISF